MLAGRFFLAAALVCLFATTAPAADIQIDKISPDRVEQYAPIFIEISTDVAFENPFDSDDIRIDAEIRDSDGRTLAVPCFFRSRNDQRSQWQCRFTPTSLGDYSVTVALTDPNRPEVAKSKSLTFTVASGTRDGFLRIDPETRYSLRFDSGKRFRGLGENVGWEPRGRRRSGGRWTYDHLLPVLSANGCNTIRTWMCPWNLTLEWRDDGLGRYNERAAQRLDQLLTLAEKNGVYVILVIGYHGELRTKPDHWGANNEWKNNPYNQQLGGPCKTPTDYFTNETAQRYYRKRLRYLVARWGYHPNLLAWELWNEVDIVMRDEKVPASAILEWHRRMTKHLDDIDPYNHLITTSVSSGFPAELWRIPEIDLTMLHLYGPTIRFHGRIWLSVLRFHKPAVISEFSFSWKSPGEVADDDAFERELHLGLWRGLFSETPVLPMTWWWEFHDKQNHWPHFEAIGNYLQCMLESDGDWKKAICTSSNKEIEIHAIQVGTSVFVWAYNRGAERFEGESILCLNQPKGAYRLTRFDTRAGTRHDMGVAPVEPFSGRVDVRIDIPRIEPGQSVAWIVHRK